MGSHCHTVLAAVVEGAGSPFELQPLTLDAPRADEVLVRICAAGICHTDVLCRDAGAGSVFPAVLGHEGAGVVEGVGGDVEGFAVGDRVAISFRSCGTCRKCTEGHPAYCETMGMLNYMGRRTDGSSALHRGEAEIGCNFFGQSSFATHALTYATNLVKLPEGLPFHLAAPLGCGVQTGAGAVMRSLGCKSGDAVVVIGAGTVGLSAVMAARLLGCDPIVVIEPMAARRALALELGASHALDPVAGAIADQVAALLQAGADAVVDTTGRADVLAQATKMLGSRGALGLVGVPADPSAELHLSISSALLAGHRVIGIIEGDSHPASFVPELAQAYLDGQFPLDRLVTCYPFDQINEAIAAQHRGECIKPVLIFEDEVGNV